MKRARMGFAGLLFVAMSLCAAGQGKWFTTYYATWSMLSLGSSNYALPPWEIDFRGLTHIVLFDNGNVTQTAPYWAYMFGSIPADAETDSLAVEFNAHAAPGDGVNRTHYLDSLVTISHRNGVKVVITIQAVAKTTPNLNYVAADSARTQLFVNTLVAWAERKKLDGVEIDWEGWAGTPLPSTDIVDRFVRILYRRVHTMKTYGGAPGIIMISAGSSYQNNYSASQDYMVDQYNLQLYDYAFAWQGAPANSAVSWHISPLHEGTRPANFEGESYETRGPLQWVAAGHDPKRIGLGIPTYGYILRNVDGLFQPMTNNGDYGSAHYQVIEALKNNGGVETWDDVRKVRSISGTALRTAGSVFYGSDGINAGQKFFAVGESPQSMQEKVNWMKANNFGGIMTYDFVSDLDPTQSIASGRRNPLQRVVAAALSGGTLVVYPTGTFTASSTTIPVGGGIVTLNWTSADAAAASIDQGIGVVALTGSMVVTVGSTKTFKLTLTHASGTQQQYSVTVAVASGVPAPTATLSVSPASLPVGGGTVTLTWNSTNAASASLDHGIGAVATTGTKAVAVAVSTTFTFTVANAAGTAAVSLASVTVAKTPTVPETGVTQSLTIRSGWSMISSYLQPSTSSLEVLFAPMAGNGIVVKNGSGDVYWPDLGINAIGVWNPLSAYQLYSKTPSSFSISGTIIDPQQSVLTLVPGINIVPYLRSTPMAPAAALAGVTDAQLIVFDEDGNFYWPGQGKNTLAALQPGHAYAIFVTGRKTFTYPGNSAAAASTVSTGGASASALGKHYTVQAGRSSVSAVMLFESPLLTNGDEVVVRSASGDLLGTGTVDHGSAAVRVWGDDSITPDIVEGARENEALSIGVWSQADQRERAFVVSNSVNLLTKDERPGAPVNFHAGSITIVSGTSPRVLPVSHVLGQNYPNPFNPSTTIRFDIAEPSPVRLTVFDVLGRSIEVLVNRVMTAGSYAIDWKAHHMPSGVYFYKLEAGAFTDVKRMLLQK